jgi:hypothetical protein
VVLLRIKVLVIVLGIGAILCLLAALCITPPSAEAVFGVISTPFVEIGGWLRTLSLSGSFGNVVAILIYGAISLCPMLFFLWRVMKKKFHIEDFLLLVMSAILFFMMYYMINPDLLTNLFAFEEFSSMGKTVLSICFYSVLTGYLILTLLRGVTRNKTFGMLDWLQLLLALIAIVLVFSVFYLNVIDVRATIQDVKSSNPEPIILLAATTNFIVIRYVLRQFPVILSIGLLLLAIKLAAALKQDKYGEEMVRVAGRLGGLCKVTVVTTVICSIAVNLLQLLFSRSLLNYDFSAQVPVTSLVLTLILLVLAQYFADSSKLHQDNQLYI